MTVHPIAPVFDEDSEILILGSFPSVKSRESMFFYGHPQNRFWKVISAVYGHRLPETIEEKKALLLSEHIAVWDVIGSCEISGSSDSSIKNVTPNDISYILKKSRIKRIFVNGKTAQKYYDKFVKKSTGMDAIGLPSTSPANAMWSLEKLTEAWKTIRE